MEVKLAYGKKGLKARVPEKNLIKILSMRDFEPVSDAPIAITKSLLQPIASPSLFDAAKRKKSACIVICDITRPVPNRDLLPPILRTLLAAGIARENILILIATGLHRPNIKKELVELVGEDIARNYRIENHFGQDINSHGYLGKSSRGTPVYLDRRFLEADFRVITGFIEPHFMAGFSGGRKVVVPGIAHFKTMQVLHGPELLSHPNSREGMVEHNPFHDEALEIARMAGVDFNVNVALNEDKEIIGIFSGDLDRSHLAGVEFVRNVVRSSVTDPVDIVITSAAGYPLDKTWYQAVKGMTAAKSIIKPGGTIIIASECSEGVGSAEFTEQMENFKSADQYLDELFQRDEFLLDQWQVQKYAAARKHAKIVTVSDGLSTEQKNKLNIDWAESVEKALDVAMAEYGEKATIAVIPKGPYVLAELQSEKETLDSGNTLTEKALT
ncbi:nickel-dependent lactate racemase [candidate division KSB1 bacterium]|nr:nickel-dependent lactate racemase [candidate division KSB1 bacterium]